MQKDYKRWMDIKASINNHINRPPSFDKRQIWWGSIGENVGVESDGKGAKYLRPVLIVKRYNNAAFFGVPLTSKIKPDRPYYYPIKCNDRAAMLQFSQARAWDASRLVRPMDSVNAASFRDIKFKLALYLKLI